MSCGVRHRWQRWSALPIDDIRIHLDELDDEDLDSDRARRSLFSQDECHEVCAVVDDPTGVFTGARFIGTASFDDATFAMGGMLPPGFDPGEDFEQRREEGDRWFRRLDESSHPGADAGDVQGGERG